MTEEFYVLIYDERTKFRLQKRNKSAFLTPFLGKRNSDLLLKSFPTLGEIAKISDEQVREKLPRISQNRIGLLRAAFQLSSEFNKETIPEAFCIECPEDLADLVREEFRFSRNEKLIGVYMNSAYHVIEMRTIAEGAPNEVTVQPRQVFEPAFRNGATVVATAHNHPGASSFPSESDREIAKEYRAIGEVLEIQFYDEVIIGDSQVPSMRDFYSMVKSGVLPNLCEDVLPRRDFDFS